MGTIQFVQRVNSIQCLLQAVTFMGRHLELSSAIQPNNISYRN